MIKFGPGGNCEDFYANGGKSSLDIPKWLDSVGLNAYEYECGRGVKISEESANVLGELAAKYGITLSVHAPYFTNISSVGPPIAKAPSTLPAKLAHILVSIMKIQRQTI